MIPRNAQRRRWTTPSTAGDRNDPPRTFRISHPFHPLKGSEHELVTWRKNWGEDRAYYHDEEGRLRSIPVAWTDLSAAEATLVADGEQVQFRLRDLLELIDLIRGTKT